MVFSRIKCYPEYLGCPAFKLSNFDRSETIHHSPNTWQWINSFTSKPTKSFITSENLVNITQKHFLFQCKSIKNEKLKQSEDQKLGCYSSLGFNSCRPGDCVVLYEIFMNMFIRVWTSSAWKLNSCMIAKFIDEKV